MKTKKLKIRSAPFKAKLPTTYNEKCFKCKAIVYPVKIGSHIIRSCENCNHVQVRSLIGEMLAPRFVNYSK